MDGLWNLDVAGWVGDGEFFAVSEQQSDGPNGNTAVQFFRCDIDDGECPPDGDVIQVDNDSPVVIETGL